MDDQHREDKIQGKFKRFNLFFLYVGIKIVYITVYNRHRGSTVSAHEKAMASVREKVMDSPCEKVITSVDLEGGRSMIDKERINSQLSLMHEKAIASVDPGGGNQQLTQKGSTVNFHM